MKALIRLLFAIASVAFSVEGILPILHEKSDLKRYPANDREDDVTALNDCNDRAKAKEQLPETIQNELQDVKRLLYAVGTLTSLDKGIQPIVKCDE